MFTTKSSSQIFLPILRPKSFCILFIIFLALFGSFEYINNRGEYLSVNIELEAVELPHEIGTFYFDVGDGMNEIDHISFEYQENGNSLQIPHLKIEALRFDPREYEGDITIKNFKINGIPFDFSQIDYQNTNNISTLKVVSKNELFIDCSKADPHFTIAENLSATIYWGKIAQAVFHFTLTYFLTLTAILLLYLVRIFKVPPRIEKYNILGSTAIFTAILLGIDIYFRRIVFQVQEPFLTAYYMNIGVLFGGLYAIQFISVSLNSKILRLFFTTVAAIFFTITHVLQYGLYYLYNDFISEEVIRTLILDYKYWLSNLLSMANAQSVLLVLFFTILFTLFFFNRKIHRPKIGIKTTIYQLYILPFLLIIFCGSHQAVMKYQALALPVPNLIDEVRLFCQLENPLVSRTVTRESEKIQPPERAIDYNVLVMVNESLRSDHLELFGYNRPTSNITEFFKNSYNFKNSISQTAVTHTSLETIFTGINLHNKSLTSSTLWSYAKQLNLATFYFGSQYLEWGGGFDKYFLEKKLIDRLFSPSFPDPAVGHDDHLTVEAFRKYIGKVDKNFFGVFHFNSTHWPYLPHQQTDQYFPVTSAAQLEKRQELMNAYDNAVHYLDIQAGEIFDILDENQLTDNTIVIFLSDHAEAFGEHGDFFHTTIFWIEGIRVPLMIHIPDHLKSRFSPQQLATLSKNTERYVANIDLFPTILEMYGVTSPKVIDGQSLFQIPEKDNLIFSTMNIGDNKFTMIDRYSFEKYTFDNRKMLRYISNLKDDEREMTYKSIPLDSTYTRFTVPKFIPKK